MQAPQNPAEEAGRAWVFGDRIDTDVLAPGALMKLTPEALARHCLEAIRPEFAAAVRTGDVVIGGASFGIGSSREQAAQSLRLLGVKAVIAKSFARIFYRNCVNLGLAIAACPAAVDVARDGSRIAIDSSGAVEVDGVTFDVPAASPLVLELGAAGGLAEWTASRLTE